MVSKNLNNLSLLQSQNHTPIFTPVLLNFAILYIQNSISLADPPSGQCQNVAHHIISESFEVRITEDHY